LNKIVQGIVICIFVQFTIGLSFATSKIPLPKIDPTSGNRAWENPSQMKKSGRVSSIHMGMTNDEEILIRVENGRLGDVLQKIANQTDIQFSIPNHLASHTINMHIRASDWETGIKTILQGFSHIMVWNGNFGMKEVLLLGKNDGKPYEDFDSASEGALSEERDRHPSPTLSPSKLRRLIQSPPGKAFPSSLFADREIRRYLQLKGIHSPDEWKQSGKVRTVLHMAKRELNRLLTKRQTLQKVK
jgi:hypothetical protein